MRLEDFTAASAACCDGKIVDQQLHLITFRAN